MTIFCCGCQLMIQPRLTDGREIYPHRPDLAEKRFWRCDQCRLHVGCHPISTRPLGVIPTLEISGARSKIHAILDPIWKSGRQTRSQVYKRLSDRLGHQYHTAEIRTIDEARNVWRAVKEIERETDGRQMP